MGIQETAKFRNAIESGLAAARNADRAIEEIKDVFAALRDAMLETSGGYVRIEGLNIRTDFLNRDEEANSIEVAANVDWRSDKRWKLGHVRVVSTGYPVTITDLEGAVRTCTSSEELESALGLLLHTPEFGRHYNAIHVFVHDRSEREARANATRESS